MNDLRHTLYMQLETDHHVRPTPLGWFLITIIILNIVAVVAESNYKLYLEHRRYFDAFEYFSLLIFTVEYAVHIWCIPEKYPERDPGEVRREWLGSATSIIDFIAIIPGILYFFTPYSLSFLRLLRLLRLLKLARYFSALRILMAVLRREQNSLQAVLMILGVVITLAASCMYVVEHKAQPKTFGTIYESMWWAVVTLTTVGYGDVTPITPLGKILGGLITVLGIGMAALPAGIIASGLADELRRRRQTMEKTFRKMLLEGRIDLGERQALRRLRKELGISQEMANEILREVLTEQRNRKKATRAMAVAPYKYCPHCGHLLPENAGEGEE